MTYIANESSAICSDPSCGFNCTPVPEEDCQFNIYYLSHCCSAQIVDEDGCVWEADVQQGNPEP